MQQEKFKKKACKIVTRILICVACSLLISIVYFIANIDNFNYKPQLSLSLKDAELFNIVYDGRRTYESTSDDPNMTFYNINQNVQSIKIDIEYLNQESTKAQIYFDYGDGFNELNSEIFNLKEGVNLIKFKNSKNLKSIRFDPGVNKSTVLTIRRIELNYNRIHRKAFYIIIVYSILLYVLLRKSKSFILECLLYSTYLYIGYCMIYRFNLGSMEIVVFLTILCSGLAFLQNIMKETDNNEI